MPRWCVAGKYMVLHQGGLRTIHTIKMFKQDEAVDWRVAIDGPSD